MKFAIIFAVVFGLIIFSFLYDINAGLTHTNNPRFYVAPSFLCGNPDASAGASTWAAIALPPFGIWICKAYFDDTAIRIHELVHWSQYVRFGTVGFYMNYAWGWMAGGFSYNNNWMEKEANR